MRTLVNQLAVVTAIAAVAVGCSTFRHEEMKVPLNTVPAVVQATIQAHTYGGTVDKVEKETMKSGVIYEAKVKGPDGQCSEIKVAEDGKLLKYKAGKECRYHDKNSTQAK